MSEVPLYRRAYVGASDLLGGKYDPLKYDPLATKGTG